MSLRLESLIRNLTARKKNDADLDSELRACTEILAEERMRQGMKPGEALALGARPRDALRLVLWQGLRLMLTGKIVGVGAAYAATRLLQSLLFGVSATDPAIFAGAVGLLFCVALAASSIPAWRAARIDPINALRYE
jgi:FtsX-like permease family